MTIVETIQFWWKLRRLRRTIEKFDTMVFNMEADLLILSVKSNLTAAEMEKEVVLGNMLPKMHKVLEIITNIRV